LILRVISPTHIGSGDKLTRIDYFYRDGRVRVIDYERAWSENERIRKMIEAGRFDPRVASNYCKYEVDAFCKPDRDILEHIKVLGRPYIPGSSLKGAVRTALLWKYLRDRGLKVKSIEELKKVEREFFASDKGDLMRFFLVRDSEPVEIKNLGIYETVILTEKNSQTLEEKSLGGGRTLKIYTESLKPDTKLEIDVRVNSKEFKELEDWKDKLLEFSRFVLSIDKEFFEKRNDGRFDRILKFIDEIEGKLDSGKVLFRLGFSTGWLWKTVGSLLTKVERLEVAKKLRLSRKFGTDFPKTRRVIVDYEKPSKKDKTYKWLPGWLEILE